MQRIDDYIVLHWSRGTINNYYPYRLFSWVYCAVGINKVNIEQDEDILDPGTFGLMEDSYLGFEFNDYPSEVLCPNPTQAQPQCQGR